jgi:hypothetical protein
LFVRSKKGGRVVAIKFSSMLLSGALLVTVAGATQRSTDLEQQAKAADAKKDSTPVTAPLSVGTAFNASLIDTLDARRARPGDVVTAEAVEPVTYERSVVFPKGTKIIGHIVRATSGGRGRAGSALFIQFDKAMLKDGEEVILNAGIQALAVGTVAPALSDADRTREGDSSADLSAPAERNLESTPTPSAEPTSGEPAARSDALVVSTIYDTPRSSVRAPLFAAPAAQGELSSDGLFTPESKGAFGRPDMKVYTPTSQGSHGTVLLSAKKNMHLESGTRLLLVVQPPPNKDADTTQIDLYDLDPTPNP